MELVLRMTGWPDANAPIMKTAEAPQIIAETTRSGVAGQTRPRWFVAYTRPHCEGRAASRLEQQEFTVFCPRIRKAVRHARRTRYANAPLFPRYLFVELDIARDRWRSVNGTAGVVELITCGELPQPVPHGIVEAIQQRLRTEGAASFLPQLKPGREICVTDGPFADFVGTLQRLDSNGRVRVLLNLLGRSVAVVVPRDRVEPAA